MFQSINAEIVEGNFESFENNTDHLIVVHEGVSTS